MKAWWKRKVPWRCMGASEWRRRHLPCLGWWKCVWEGRVLNLSSVWRHATWGIRSKYGKRSRQNQGEDI